MDEIRFQIPREITSPQTGKSKEKDIQETIKSDGKEPKNLTDSLYGLETINRAFVNKNKVPQTSPEPELPNSANEKYIEEIKSEFSTDPILPTRLPIDPELSPEPEPELPEAPIEPSIFEDWKRELELLTEPPELPTVPTLPTVLPEDE